MAAEDSGPCLDIGKTGKIFTALEGCTSGMARVELSQRASANARTTYLRSYISSKASSQQAAESKLAL